MDSSVINMLARARYCFENGQVHIARRTFDAAIQRIGGIDKLQGRFRERAITLDEEIGQPVDEVVIPKPEVTKHPCLRCASDPGWFPRRPMVCFVCHGKGWLTNRELKRQQIYWDYVQTTKRKEALF